MSAQDLIAELRNLDIRLWVEGDKLRYSAPPDVMTEARLKRLAENKQAVIEWLSRAVDSNSQIIEPVKPVPRDRSIQASFAQERLLFISSLMPDSDSYNVPLQLKLTGKLDQSALQKSLNAIVARHESLRTSFVTENGQYIQVIKPQLNVPLIHISLTEYDDGSKSRKLHELVTQERAIPFDLSTGPVIRATLIQISSIEYALLITLHHIVCDGWSLGILFKDLRNFYEAFSTGSGVDVPVLKIQYADFSVWQRQLLSGITLERQVNYWRNKLEGLTTLQLPTDFPRPQLQTFEGGQIIKILPEKLSGNIRQLSESSGATLFMTMLASFNVLLYRYCHQDDIVIGTPIANRNRIEIEEIIGFFVNMLVIRTDMSGSPTFEMLLKRVKESALEAYQHQDLPFEKLVEELNTERDLSRNPLFQVSFAMQNAPVEGVELQGLSIQSLELDEATTTRFDLEVNVMESGSQLVVSCTYNTRLFRKKTIEKMLEHYQELLSNITADPNRSVDTLKILTDEELQKIIYQWNQTRHPKTHHLLVHQLVEKMALENGSHPAVISNKQSLDYAALNQSANQLAHYLLSMGAGAASPVTVLMTRTTDMVAALLAILKTGSQYVPIDPDYPEQRLAFILEDTKSNIVITQSDLESRLAGFSGHVVCLEKISEKLKQQSVEAPEISVTVESTAYVIYTSGSTGEPKGVEVSHSGLANLVAWHQREYNPGINDRASHLAGLGFDASVWELWPYLSCGSTLYLVPDELRLSATGLWEWIVEHGISLCFMPTPLAEAVLAEVTADSFNRPGFKLRALLTGGDKLHGALSQQKLPFRVVNHYGPTENTVVTTCVDVDVHDDNEPAIGRPIDNVQVYILDEHMQTVPVGVTGILYIGGDSLAKGYFNHKELTREKFVEHSFSAKGSVRLYNTGDLARFREDGMIEFAGRNDHQIKLRGFRIEPGEIEAVLNAHESVQSAAVLVHRVNSGSSTESKQLVAYVILNAAAICDEDELLSELQDKLPVYMVPSAIIFIDEFPLTANGKLDREALPAPEVKTTKPDAPGVADSALEKSISAIWSDLLGVENIGTRDNFFDLGGHSLLLGKLHARLKADLDADIAMVDLFRYTTVESLARYLGGDVTSESISEQIKQRSKQRRDNNIKDDAIAVTGMAGQFPGSPDIQSYWNNLLDGVESIRFFTEEELSEAGIPEAVFKNPDFVPARGYLDDADMFDAAFFAYSPREAELIDPQQRIFLETCWHALEHAACDPQTYPGLISVFAGASMSHYLQNIYSRPDLLATAGMEVVINNEKDFLATRISYKLDLKGPSFTLQTACSTSLVAIHEACRNLRDYDCDIALAGGVSVGVPRINGYTYQQGSILSPDGHCRAFDAKANGTVGGEGAGVVVLKRLKDAINDNDTIHAVIKGSAINNDGADKAGFTAPGIQGQVNVIAMAHAAAEVAADTIDYVETHGTGTTLGDPIEVSALTQAFGQNIADKHAGASQEKKRCALGAVKTNIGHLDAAAGVAGFIKTVLSIEHEKIPPSLHYTEANPEIDFEHSPFYVNNTVRDWPSNNNSPRRAGISSFGIGGTNAHVILEQAPDVKEEVNNWVGGETPAELLILSAKTAAALKTKMQQLAEHIELHGDIKLKDIAYTLQRGRSMLEHRCMLVCEQAESAVRSLQANDPDTVSHGEGNVSARKIVFMFSGQGAQYPDMAKDLYLRYEVFRNTVDDCCETLRPHIELNLLDLLFPEAGQQEHASQQLMLTQYAQCSLFVIEYATAKLWMHWGVEPSAMIGHSIGEYVAACLSGVISLNDALILVANRGRLMQAQPPGSMLSVPMSAADIQDFIPEELAKSVSVATVNSPNMCVVSGEDRHIELLEQLLLKDEHNARRLHTSHAFHSSMMQAVLEPFSQLFDRIKLYPPEIPFVSNLTGDWIKEVEATDAAYWGSHIRNTVLFSDGLKTLMQDGFNCFIETGPGNTLATFARQHTSFASADTDISIVSSIRHPRQEQNDVGFMLNSLGRIWLSGHPLDWHMINKEKPAQRIPLPVYPFERKRYWIEQNTASSSAEHEGNVSKNKNIDRWLYIPAWKSSLMNTLDDTFDVSGRWIVFANNSAACESIITYLEGNHAEVIRVIAADQYQRKSATTYTLNPASKNDFEQLLADENVCLLPAQRIIHCWGLSDSRSEEGSVSASIIEKEYYSLLFMLQSMLSVWPDLTVHINMITQYSQSVTGQERVVPEKSMATALLKVLSQEVAGLSYNICDLNDEEISSLVKKNVEMPVLPEVLQSVLSAGVKHQANRLDAYRFNRRWTQVYDNIDLPELDAEQLPLHLRTNGVYLITGGLGGVGLSIAHYLADKVKARLILTARTSLPEKTEWDQYLKLHDETDKAAIVIQQIRLLETAGAEVMVANVDVTDLAGMQELVANIESRFGQINGVVHAAGIVSGSSLAPAQSLKFEDCELQFAPKVYGLMVLKNLFENHPPDFVMPVSSLSSVLGGLGFSAYSAANQFMDSVCQQQHNKGQTHWLSVNWEGWNFQHQDEESPGVTDGSSSALMLSVAEGQQVFERIMNLPRTAQLVISTGDLDLRLKQWVLQVGKPEAESDNVDLIEPGNYERPDLSSSHVGAKTESQKKMAEIWGSLFNINDIGIHDNFFELGGHSLLAVQAVAIIKDKFDITIAIDKFLELGTIDKITSYIDALEWVESSAKEDFASDDSRNEFEL